MATTFTLDLPMALVAPLAFASYDMRTRQDPIAMLEAVRGCAGRVDIFCQAGQINVPGQASDLMAFLEPMLYPVRRPRGSHLFHPKVWFLRFTADDEPDAYRLVCSTRNLAASHAWDAAITLNGRIGRTDARNKPLAAFLRRLPGCAVRGMDPQRLARVEDLAARAARIRWDLPEHVRDYAFHAFGVPRLEPTARFDGYRHLVVSPFLDEAGLQHVTDGNRDAYVVSRPEELDRLEPDVLDRLAPGDDHAVFALDPLAGLGPDEAGHDTATGPNTDSRSGLHAKITIVERARRAHVMIGSANATSAAYGGNVEFVTELVAGATKLGVAAMMAGDSTDGEQPPFRAMLQPYTRSDISQPDEDDERRRLENHLRALAETVFATNVVPDGNTYSLQLRSERPVPLRADHTLDLELLTRPGHAHRLAEAGPCDLVFEGVPLADVTPFVALHLTGPDGTTLGTIVHSRLLHDPPERLDTVLARQVDTPEKFLRFVSLLLGLADPDALWAQGFAAGQIGAGSGAVVRPRTALLELVLHALADRPEALRDLDGLVGRLRHTDTGRSTLPDGFEELWDAVTHTLDSLDVPDTEVPDTDVPDTGGGA